MWLFDFSHISISIEQVGPILNKYHILFLGKTITVLHNAIGYHMDFNDNTAFKRLNKHFKDW